MALSVDRWIVWETRFTRGVPCFKETWPSIAWTRNGSILNCNNLALFNSPGELGRKRGRGRRETWTFNPLLLSPKCGVYYIFNLDVHCDHFVLVLWKRKIIIIFNFIFSVKWNASLVLIIYIWPFQGFI